MYPTRSESHIREEIGISTLKSLIPVEWILRDITGRDYGHDAILQITKTNSNEVLPYSIGIQIKYRGVSNENINQRYETEMSVEMSISKADKLTNEKEGE